MGILNITYKHALGSQMTFSIKGHFLVLHKGNFYSCSFVVITYSPSCRSKPIKPLFIFRTQIKIFMMKSESFLTLHRQQRNRHVQDQER